MATLGLSLLEAVNYLSEQRILLHLCCGPCAVWPVAFLRGQGYEVEGLWHNPNIHPFGEYQARLMSCRQFASVETMVLHEQAGYGLRSFLSAVWPDQTEKPERCEICYRLRLTGTASKAQALGIDAISTTLLVSPYQDQDRLAVLGREVAAAHGLTFVYHDWRGGFREAKVRSKEMGLYSQQYCGCLFSEQERFGLTKSDQ
jgi:epoxyqueuosine reductase